MGTNSIFDALCTQLDRKRGLRIAAVSIALVYVAAGLLTLHNDHYWGDDWAQYVGHARNLALSKPYADTGYLFNPQSPGVGPAVSQPGLPLMLAPVYAVFGLNLVALKAAEFLFLCVGLALAAMAMTETFGATIALIAIALTALHPAVLWLRQVVMTEPPYILFAFLAIVLAKLRWRSTAPLHIFGYAVLTGLALVATFSMRQIGVSLLVAMVACDLVQRRPLLKGTLPIISVFAAGALLLQRTMTVADYSTELKSSSSYQAASNSFLPALWQRANGYVDALGALVPQPFHLANFAATVLLLLAAIGVASICRRPRAMPLNLQVVNQQPAGLSAWLAACPLEVWYLGTYLGALLVLPVFPDLRLLLPIVPILFALALTGAGVFVTRTGKRQKMVVAALLSALCLYVVALQSHADSGALRLRPDGGEGQYGAFCDDCQGMYAFVNAHTPADARIAFAKPRALALLAHRRSWVWSRHTTESATWESMRRVQIDYIVVTRNSHVLSSSYPDFLSWEVLAHRSDLSMVFTNNTFRIYRITWN